MAHRPVEFTASPAHYNPLYHAGFLSVTPTPVDLRLITRYILREHVGPLLFAVSTLTSLLILNYVSKNFAQFVGKGLPWSVIAEYFVLAIPFTVAMTLPMAVLIATLYAFSRLAADSEVTALMANGVGVRRLMAPVLSAGLVLSIGMVWFNDQVLPRANYRLNGLSASIAQKKPTLALREQTLNQLSHTLYLRMARLDNGRNAMRDVTIHDMADPTVHRTIVAETGLLAFAPNGRDLRLTLFDGYVQETHNARPGELQRVFFRENVIRVPDVANQLARSDEPGYRGDREMSICDMNRQMRREQGRRDSLRVALAAVDPAAASAHPVRFGGQLGAWYCAAVNAVFPAAEAQVSRLSEQKPGTSADPAAVPVQVQSLQLNIERAERSISQFDVEIHKKFAISVACLIFALLGPPIALRFPRSGVGLTIGVSLSVFALYYVGLIAGEELANNLLVSPLVAMWAANALLGAVGVVLALRMGRAGAHARGGGLAELVARVWPGGRTRAT